MTGSTAEIINHTSERNPSYDGIGATVPVPFGQFPEGAKDIWLSAGGQHEYTFPNLKTYGAATSEAIRMVRSGRIIEAIEAVRSSTLKHFTEKSSLERWAHMAVQLPSDWGPSMKHRPDMKQRLTGKARGVVLEAMCGFTTYIDDAPHISDVIALDWCRESLERYERPDRARLMFDLDSVKAAGDMSFLKEGTIDSVCITFGVDYLNSPAVVYQEFHRILSAGGNVLLIGGESNGYEDQLKQAFRPDFHCPLLKDAGFNVEATHLPYRRPTEFGEYYLIEATK